MGRCRTIVWWCVGLRSGYFWMSFAKPICHKGMSACLEPHRLSREAHNCVTTDGGVWHVPPDVVHDSPVSAVCVAPPADTLLLQTYGMGEPG